jgi:hypothetical protein
MSKNTYPLKLPTSVKKAAAELAATDGRIIEPIHRGGCSGEGRFLTRRG